MRKVVFSGVALLIVSSFACSLKLGGLEEAPIVEPDGGQADSAPASNDDAGGLAPPNTSGRGAGTGANTGLPCDVQQLLENRCIACHAGASPPPLLTYEDLIAKSVSDPTKTMAELSVLRMKSTAQPMPPSPAVPPDAAEIATFEAWVAAGTPSSQACTSAPDGGVSGLPDAGPDVADGCTSGAYWSDDDEGSPMMRPGGPCQTCHQQRGGPRFDVAGTVYPSAHEPDDCNGKGPPPELTIVVTDKNNHVTTIPVNAVGNFYTTEKVLAPFTVVVRDGTKTRAMAGSVTAGDCNACHTQAGANGAPGRIISP